MMTTEFGSDARSTYTTPGPLPRIEPRQRARPRVPRVPSDVAGLAPAYVAATGIPPLPATTLPACALHNPLCIPCAAAVICEIGGSRPPRQRQRRRQR